MMADNARSDFEYDVALSFAGENRAYVADVARRLQSHGVRVFYDDYEQATLWGKNLYDHLDRVYGRAAHYCILFVSEHYAKKMWTNHERQSAQARALEENREYVLPVRFDDTEIPGLRSTIGYVDARQITPDQLARLALEKLGRLRTDTSPPAAVRTLQGNVRYPPSWEGQTLLKSKERPQGGPQQNTGVEHITFKQHHTMYVVATVLLLMVTNLLVFIVLVERSTLARLLWGGLAVLTLSFTLICIRFARFPVSLDVGARGIELFHRRGWIWLPWSVIERVEVIRFQSQSHIVAWFNGSDDFPDFDAFGGGPQFLPKLGGASLCSVGILRAPRQEIVRALCYFSQNHIIE